MSARPRTDLPARWPPRRIAAAALATVVFALAVGVPTGLVPTPLYTRMTPVLWWNYVVWAVTAALGGLVVATYIRRPHDRAPRNGAAAASGGGLLTAFAVGCPVCNKLVVATLGVSGAMTVWAPLQPVLAVLSIVGLGWALRRRLQNEYACSASSDRRERGAGPSEPPLVASDRGPSHSGVEGEHPAHQHGPAARHHGDAHPDQQDPPGDLDPPGVPPQPAEPAAAAGHPPGQ